MIADFNTLPLMFIECNKKYFNSSLPRPKYDIMHKNGTLAKFVYNKNKNGKYPIRLQKIVMSDLFDFPEDIFRDIVIHEMIHYYIAWNGIKDNKTHGREFMKMANELNEKYGLNVTKYFDASPYLRPEFASKKRGLFNFLFGR